MCRAGTRTRGAAGRRGRPRARSPSAPRAERSPACRATAVRRRRRPPACRQAPETRPASAATAAGPRHERGLTATVLRPDAPAPARSAQASRDRRSSRRWIFAPPRISTAAERRSPPPRSPPGRRRTPRCEPPCAVPAGGGSGQSPDRSPADRTPRRDRSDEPAIQAHAESPTTASRDGSHHIQPPRRPRPTVKRRPGSRAGSLPSRRRVVTGPHLGTARQAYDSQARSSSESYSSLERSVAGDSGSA